MKTVLFSWMFASAMLALGCTAAPAGSQPSSLLAADEKSEKDSVNANEVGPDENWTLFNRFDKSVSPSDRSDSVKTRELLKQIEEFSRLVTTMPPPPSTDATTDDDDDDDGNTATTTGRTAAEDVSDIDSAASDQIRLGTTWRNRDVAADQEDESNIEDTIRKITTDLKKLYGKIKEVITVVKNWIKSTRRELNGYDEQLPMSASASQSDGVFLISEPLIGDMDKSNKYTVPIFAD